MLLFAGSAQTRGPFHLTMDTNDAIETAQAFPDAVIVPVHHEGWAHFRQSGDDLAESIQCAGLRTAFAPAATWRRDTGRVAALVTREDHAGKPADQQRHQRGGRPVQQAMVARGVGDVLLKSGLDDFQRRIGACGQIAIGEQLDIDDIAAGRYGRGQGNGGAEYRGREERHRGSGFAVETLLRLQPHESPPERIAGHCIGNIDTDALWQQKVIEPDLEPSQRIRTWRFR